MKKDILFLLFLINLAVVLNIFLTLYYKHNICTFAGWKKKQNKNTEWMSILLSNLHWLKIGIIEGDNIIVKPLLTEKKGSLRVTILLSNLCWLNNGIIEGDNIIVKPLLTENGSLRVTILLSHLLKQNRDCRVNNKIENVKSLWHTDEQWKLFHQKCLTESSAQMT